MANFPGGSAWAMVRDIAGGYLAATERTFRPFQRPDLDRMEHELDRLMREIRSEQPPLDDVAALQQRNRKLQRLRSAQVMLRAYRTKMKK